MKMPFPVPSSIKFSTSKTLWLLVILTLNYFITSCSSSIYSKGVKINTKERQYNNYGTIEIPDSVLVGISVAGGGTRAQYFATGVFLALEEMKFNKTNVLEETRLFSTVSGGGFAAAYYLSNKLLQKKTNTITSFKQTIEKKLENGDLFQESVMINTNPIKNLLIYNLLMPIKRMKMIRKEMSYKLLLKEKLGEISISEFKDELNIMLNPNGTIFNNSVRIPLNKKNLSDNNITGVFKITDTIKMVDLIQASSAFPAILPSVRFKINHQKDDCVESVVRVVDGGVAENLGYVSLLRMMVRTQKQKNYAIVIDCSGEGAQNEFSKKRYFSIAPILDRVVYQTISTKYAVKSTEIEDCIENEFIRLRGDKATIKIKNENSSKNIKVKCFSNKDTTYEFNVYQIGITDLIDMKNQPELDSTLTYLESVEKSIFKDNYSTKKFKKAVHKIFYDRNTHINFLLTSNIDSLKYFYQSLTPFEKLVFYEYVAHIDTKLSIEPFEMKILILGGKIASALRLDSSDFVTGND